ncbi:MAG TPA: hypothetical protein VKT77_06765, partial [Chthonomonadaceae bacterium]|nr:hypothetical protein [Chthonomonadaceae bacterium]
MSIVQRLAAVGTAAILLALAPATVQSGQRPARQWEPVGLSGGGAMFTPAISPADPNRMMLNCDMSAAYVTRDAGRHWTMIDHDQLRSSTRCKPAFHPTDPNTIFAADGGLKVSHDGGLHWANIGNLPGNLTGAIAIDPLQPANMLAGAGSAVYRSTDSGQAWSKCEGPHGTPLAFFIARTGRPERPLFAATSEGIWRSVEGSERWDPVRAGLPDGPILDFAGGCSAARNAITLYCSTPTELRDGKLSGGIFRSTDRGASWQPVEGAGLNRDTAKYDEWAMGPIAQYRHVATSDARPETVYAFNTNTGVPPPHHA